MIRCQHCGGEARYTDETADRVQCSRCPIEHRQIFWDSQMEIVRAEKRFLLTRDRLRSGDTISNQERITMILNKLYGKAES